MEEIGEVSRKKDRGSETRGAIARAQAKQTGDNFHLEAGVCDIN